MCVLWVRKLVIDACFLLLLQAPDDVGFRNLENIHGNFNPSQIITSLFTQPNTRMLLNEVV